MTKAAFTFDDYLYQIRIKKWNNRSVVFLFKITSLACLDSKSYMTI